MEWVEVQGKTIDLAVEVAMAELEVSSRDDVTVEVLQEPKTGFLGMGGQEAIVKVTRAPKKRRRNRNRGRDRGKTNRGKTSSKARSDASQKNTNSRESKGPSPSDDNRGSSNGRGSDRARSGGAGQEAAVTTDTPSGGSRRDDRPEPAPITEQADVAREFLTGLLDAFGLEGSIDTRIDDDILYLDVTGSQTEALVGPKGSVMQSVLELTRTVVQRKTYGAPRMRIDIAGYAERRREALRIYAGKLSEQVIEEKSEIMLEPMNAADRKVLHDAVAEIEGVRSFSEGQEPRRAVVLAYDGDEEEEE
jgi:spoIIIJ-associated protein